MSWPSYNIIMQACIYCCWNRCSKPYMPMALLLSKHISWYYQFVAMVFVMAIQLFCCHNKYYSNTMIVGNKTNTMATQWWDYTSYSTMALHSTHQMNYMYNSHSFSIDVYPYVYQVQTKYKPIRKIHIYEPSTNHISLIKRPRCHAKSPTVHSVMCCGLGQQGC